MITYLEFLRERLSVDLLLTLPEKVRTLNATQNVVVEHDLNYPIKGENVWNYPNSNLRDRDGVHAY